MKTLAKARDKTDILARMERVRPDSRGRWGRMSAHQMICHLADALRMAIGRKAVSPATGLLQRTIVKWIVLYAPAPWPAGIRTRPEIDQEIGGTAPREFASDVADLEALLNLIATGPVEWRPHPIFGPMSQAAWLRWAYRHADYHLRQFGV